MSKMKKLTEGEGEGGEGGGEGGEEGGGGGGGLEQVSFVMQLSFF